VLNIRGAETPKQRGQYQVLICQGLL
jgi:hypothetical protein